jgi:putative transcriptional regulator
VRSAVAAARRRRGLTQAQLAQLAGVSRQTVVEIEHGDYNPSVALALRLAVLLETSVHQLFQLPEAEVAALLAARDGVAPDPRGELRGAADGSA